MLLSAQTRAYTHLRIIKRQRIRRSQTVESVACKLDNCADFYARMPVRIASELFIVMRFCLLAIINRRTKSWKTYGDIADVLRHRHWEVSFAVKTNLIVVRRNDYSDWREMSRASFFLGRNLNRTRPRWGAREVKVFIGTELLERNLERTRSSKTNDRAPSIYHIVLFIRRLSSSPFY